MAGSVCTAAAAAVLGCLTLFSVADAKNRRVEVTYDMHAFMTVVDATAQP